MPADLTKQSPKIMQLYPILLAAGAAIMIGAPPLAAQQTTESLKSIDGINVAISQRRAFKAIVETRAIHRNIATLRKDLANGEMSLLELDPNYRPPATDLLRVRTDRLAISAAARMGYPAFVGALAGRVKVSYATFVDQVAAQADKKRSSTGKCLTGRQVQEAFGIVTAKIIEEATGTATNAKNMGRAMVPPEEVSEITAIAVKADLAIALQAIAREPKDLIRRDVSKHWIADSQVVSVRFPLGSPHLRIEVRDFRGKAILEYREAESTEPVGGVSPGPGKTWGQYGTSKEPVNLRQASENFLGYSVAKDSQLVEKLGSAELLGKANLQSFRKAAHEGYLKLASTEQQVTNWHDNRWTAARTQSDDLDQAIKAYHLECWIVMTIPRYHWPLN